nr:hypothetical protein [Tanacetum cinerariifolium]
LNTFYNALNPTDQDSLNATAAPVKAVKETCVTCGGAHPYYQCLATGGNTFPEFKGNIQEYGSAAAANYNQGNPGYRPQGVANQMRPLATTQHNQNFHLNELERIKKMNEVSMKAMQNQIDMVKNELRNEMKTSIQTSLSNQTNELRDMMASFMRMNTASPSSSGTLPGNTVANPKSDLKEITTRSGVSYDGPSISPPVVENAPEATKDTMIPTNKGNIEDVQPQDMSFEISFTDALILMPKFASTLKALISNKEKLSEMARTPLNEHCSAVLLKKLPEKLGDPGKFLIPFDFLGMAECLALADLEDVYVKVGSFHFSTDFVVVDFDADPRVPLILERSFLKTERALMDVFEGELTLRVGKEAITFNLDQTSRYSANYNDMTAKRIDVIDMACEEYSQEVFGFSDVTASGNLTPIVSTTSPTLTPFGDSDFLLFEEANVFLGLEDDPDLPELDPSYYDPEGTFKCLKLF